MNQEKLQAELRNGTAEIAGGAAVFLGSAVVEIFINGAIIVGLVISTPLVFDGIRRYNNTRLET